MGFDTKPQRLLHQTFTIEFHNIRNEIFLELNELSTK